jgi:hypothetical protein
MEIATQSIPLEVLLSNACKEISDENPLEYFSELYRTVSPLMMNELLVTSRNFLQKENKKNGTPVNVHFTIGGDGKTRSLYTGLIGGLLWLQDFITAAAPRLQIDAQEVATCLKVLRALDLPQATDSSSELTPNSSCRHYAYFLSSFVTWLSSGILSFKQKDKVRSNLELSRFLTGMALKSFPSIPYTAYYIGSIKTNDMFELSEKLSKLMDFSNYMGDLSVELNQPQFVVQSENAPLVGMAGHPLANMIYGQVMKDNVEWFGVFRNSDEFKRLCLNAGLTSVEVQKYVLVNSYDSHKHLLTKNNPISKFIESQNFTKEIFEMKDRLYSIEKDDDEIIEMLKPSSALVE